ncbi:MAG: DUF58 domain-containing protein [Gammaproteobacteria bacterium]
MAGRLTYRAFRRVQQAGDHLERRLTPAGRALAVAAIGAGAFAINPRQTLAFQALTLFVALLAMAFAGSLRRAPRLAAARRTPAHATAGVPCTVRLDVRNDGPRTEVDLLLHDSLDPTPPTAEEFARTAEPALPRRNWFDRKVGYPRWLDAMRTRRGGDTVPVGIARLAPGESVEIAVPLAPVRRGYLHFDRIWVMRPDPLGLVNSVHALPLPQPLLVLPRLHPVRLPRAAGPRRYQPGGERTAISVGDSQEFAGLRDYRPGDSPRHIHWRGWARTGLPVVKEFHDEYFDRSAVILDTCTADGGDRLEAAVSIAASFVAGQWGPDRLLDLLLMARGPAQFTAGRGLSGSARLLEVLACAAASPPEAFADLARAVEHHLTRIGLAICVLLDWDEPRRALVSTLCAHRVPVLVLVAGAEAALDPGPLAFAPQRLVPVPVDGIAAALAQVQARLSAGAG